MCGERAPLVRLFYPPFLPTAPQPFNAWDRIPFFPGKGPGKVDLLSRNLLLSNFNSGYNIDTDDGSAYWHMLRNVQLYGSFLKSDFTGHSIEYDRCISVFGGPANQYQHVDPTTPNSIHDCTLIQSDVGENLINHVCPPDADFPIIYNVTLFNPVGPNSSTVCKTSIEDWQAMGKGYLPGVSVNSSAMLSTETILGWVHNTLEGE